MKLTALTLSSERYFPRYGKFIDEAEGGPERIKSVNDLEKYNAMKSKYEKLMQMKSFAQIYNLQNFKE